jgi:hypothetical protein
MLRNRFRAFLAGEVIVTHLFAIVAISVIAV